MIFNEKKKKEHQKWSHEHKHNGNESPMPFVKQRRKKCIWKQHKRKCVCVCGAHRRQNEDNKYRFLFLFFFRHLHLLLDVSEKHFIHIPLCTTFVNRPFSHSLPSARWWCRKQTVTWINIIQQQEFYFVSKSVKCTVSTTIQCIQCVNSWTVNLNVNLNVNVNTPFIWQKTDYDPTIQQTFDIRITR